MSRMRGTIPSLPQDVLMAWFLIKHRDKFTFFTLFSLENSLEELKKTTKKKKREVGTQKL
jgi:hypothetical protein